MYGIVPLALSIVSPALLGLAPPPSPVAGQQPQCGPSPIGRAIVATAAVSPAAARPRAADPAASGAGPIELFRASDGLFYGIATINGQPLCLLIDTGASIIVLTPEDARRVGAVPAAQPALIAETAGGRHAMASATLSEVAMGNARANRVSAVIAGTGLNVSLLGQNWLSFFKSVTIEGDRMTLD